MIVLKNLNDVKSHLDQQCVKTRCLADTGFLYALAYDDDLFFNKAYDAFELLSECNTSIYTNIVSRMEFLDLMFRKQVTYGAIHLFEKDPIPKSKTFFNLLKNIRDQESRGRKINNSYKVGEHHLKKLRNEIIEHYGRKSWQDFCHQFVGKMLINEWQILENELGLNFIEALEGTSHELLNSSLYWLDVVEIISHQGIRVPDSMIINLFSKSKFDLLITSDRDFKKFYSTSEKELNSKAVYVL